jgi:aspartate dehydrogenase
VVHAGQRQIEHQPHVAGDPEKRIHQGQALPDRQGEASSVPMCGTPSRMMRPADPGKRWSRRDAETDSETGHAANHSTDHPGPPMRLGLIGFGASGRAVADLVRAGQAGDVEVVGVLVRDMDRHAEDARGTGWPFVTAVADLLELSPAVVAELAGHEALRRYGPALLRQGGTLIALSAGALGEDATWEELHRAAAEGGSRLILPSGAIAGLDAIESAAVVGIDRATHVVRKPPRSLLPADEADAVTASGAPRELYRGPAREATRRFPQNVNVVAMVSLAGIGLDRTEAVVIADPGVDHNTHEVTAIGPFGSIEVRIQNVPSPDNPRTGMIVAGSVIRSLRRLRSDLLVGG